MRKDVERDEEGGGPSAWSGRWEDSFGETPDMCLRLNAASRGEQAWGGSRVIGSARSSAYQWPVYGVHLMLIHTSFDWVGWGWSKKTKFNRDEASCFFCQANQNPFR